MRVEAPGIGDNGAPFDFYEFFDLVVNSSATTTEKLIALITGRHIGRNGEAAYPSRARLIQQASASDNTFQRALPVVRVFFLAEQRRGRATMYRPNPTLVASEIEAAILKMRAQSMPQNSTPQNGVYPKTMPQNGAHSPESTPQNGAGVCPKMGQQKDGLKEERKIDTPTPNTELALGEATEKPSQLSLARKAFELYNETARRCDLPIARVLPAARERALILRIREAGGLDGFREALANIEKSAFLQGQTSHNFRADLEFVCQAKSFRRLIEGGYGNGAHAKLRDVKPPDMPQVVWDKMQAAKARASAC